MGVVDLIEMIIERTVADVTIFAKIIIWSSRGIRFREIVIGARCSREDLMMIFVIDDTG